MDLIALSRKAFKNPFHFTHLFVIFVISFLFLICGLSLVSITSGFLSASDRRTGCDFTQTKTISGNASATVDIGYLVNFKGNEHCFFTTYVTWEDPDDAVNFWVYDPKGNVNVVEPGENQTHNQLYNPSPLLSGEWKIVLKARENRVPFSGVISFN